MKTVKTIIVACMLLLPALTLPASSWLPPAAIQQNAQGDEITETMEKLEALYRLIESTFIYDIDTDAVFDSMAKGLFSALNDPYSEYITEEESSDIQDLTMGVYGGIGAYISKPNPSYIDYDDPESYMVTIVSPFEGSPAAKAGLHAGDLISEIDGEPVDEYTVQEAAANLRGEPGTIVSLTVHRRDVVLTIRVERAIVEIPTVRADMIDTTGYLHILEFTPITPEKVREALDQFEEASYSSMILDLRSNPGGSVDSAVQIADLFLDARTVLIMETGPEQKVSRYTTDSGVSVPEEIPLVILTNAGTASSSEILAGSLRDNDRAVIVGSTSFGKGLVQNVYPFDGGDYFKITSGRYLTPDGTDIHEIGIVPDIEVVEPELSEDELNLLTSLQEEKLIDSFTAEREMFVDEEVNAFVEELQNSGYPLSSRYLRKLIRNSFEETMDAAPVYDLEFDMVLQKALEIIESGGTQ